MHFNHLYHKEASSLNCDQILLIDTTIWFDINLKSNVFITLRLHFEEIKIVVIYLIPFQTIHFVLVAGLSVFTSYCLFVLFLDPFHRTVVVVRITKYTDLFFKMWRTCNTCSQLTKVSILILIWFLTSRISCLKLFEDLEKNSLNFGILSKEGIPILRILNETEKLDHKFLLVLSQIFLTQVIENYFEFHHKLRMRSTAYHQHVKIRVNISLFIVTYPSVCVVVIF